METPVGVADGALTPPQGSLLEMARIDDPAVDARILGTKEIWIYGKDRSSMTPHFHYLDRTGSPQFELEIGIEDLSICRSAPRDGVPDGSLLTWAGLDDARQALALWLERPNADVPSVTNCYMLKVAWNQNNRDRQVSGTDASRLLG